MLIHFPTRAAAIVDLESHGFRQIKNGAWVNSVCRATIHQAVGEVVAVLYSEID